MSRIDLLILADSKSFDLAKHAVDNTSAQFINASCSKYQNNEFNICIKNKILNEDTFIIHRLGANIHEDAMKLVFISSLLKSKGANKITAIVPYLPYGRQNEAMKITFIQTMSKFIDHLITFDFHSSIDISLNLEVKFTNIIPSNIFNECISKIQTPLIVAPDQGALIRASKFADYYQYDLLQLKKFRKNYNSINIDYMSGVSPANRNCIIVDDIIDSGGTIKAVSSFLNDHSANSIHACITHFQGSHIHFKNILHLYTTNSIPHSSSLPPNLTSISLSSYITSLIKNMSS